MDFSQIWQILFLGILEGITEFLPVSSTGHLILAVDLLGFSGPPGRVFEVFIQLGSILAVLIAFWGRFFHVLRTLHNNKTSQHFVLVLLLAFAPAMALGGLLHDFIKSVLFNPYVVCVALVLGGALLIWLDKRAHEEKYFDVDDVPYATAVKIGFIQCLAMIPGVSRAGATMMGGLWLGLDRKTAAEFSFFLALPTMVGAVTYDIYKNMDALQSGDWQMLWLGFLVAFLSGLAAVKSLLLLVRKYGFAPFGWYRICLGVMMLAILVLR